MSFICAQVVLFVKVSQICIQIDMVKFSLIFFHRMPMLMHACGINSKPLLYPTSYTLGLAV